MVQIRVHYTGQLHCLAQHMPSGQEIETDAPVDNGGKGSTFSPTDLLAASLATCIATILALYGKKKGIDLSDMKLHVEKIMSSSPPRRVIRLEVDIWMPIALPSEERKKLAEVAVSTPLHHSLHPEIEIPLQIHWPDD